MSNASHRVGRSDRATIRRWCTEGETAKGSGLPATACPYRKHTKARLYWLQGYDYAPEPEAPLPVVREGTR